MIGRVWSAFRRARRSREARQRLTVVLTDDCRDRLAIELGDSLERGHEGIVYFVGLTTGSTTLAVSAVRPGAVTTAGSVDVSALEVGRIIREAALAGLQVVGQLHTHPHGAYHSAGDLIGMRIRHPGYFSIVAPNYGLDLPSLQRTHALMWTTEGFEELDEPVRIYEVPGA